MSYRETSHSRSVIKQRVVGPNNTVLPPV